MGLEIAKGNFFVVKGNFFVVKNISKGNFFVVKNISKGNFFNAKNIPKGNFFNAIDTTNFGKSEVNRQTIDFSLKFQSIVKRFL
ncbi:TPA_asm: hypothetical protein GD958_09580 [Campylobacter coli]|nr:hypothetical protein [Campylobacter coli]